MSRKNRGLRTCLFTNKQFARQELIRLVKQNNQLVVDEKQNMPGRGYWLKPTKEALRDPKLITILSKKTKCSVTEETINQIKNIIK